MDAAVFHKWIPGIVVKCSIKDYLIPGIVVKCYIKEYPVLLQGVPLKNTRYRRIMCTEYRYPKKMPGPRLYMYMYTLNLQISNFHAEAVLPLQTKAGFPPLTLQKTWA
jgi:hypothetical protein